jgi:TolA-binding protein
MSCEDARAAFTELYDGTLSGPPLAELSRHLDGCPTCRAEWDTFRSALQALAELRDAEPTPGFAARVTERLETASRWRRLLREAVFPLPVKLPLHAAALIVLVLAGTWLFQGSPEIRRAADLRVPAPPTAPTPAPAPTPLPPLPKADEAKALPAPMPPAVKDVPAAKREAVLRAPAPAAAPPAAPAAPPPQAPLPPPASAPSVPTAPLPAADSGVSRMEQAAPKAELRAARMPAAPAAPPAATKEAAGGAGPAGSADVLFSGAATAYAGQQFERAAEGFRAFLAQQPTDRRAADARFFLASSYLALKQFAEASAEFDTFLLQYPDHRRAPTALYRQGEARLEAGDAAGCQILRSALSQHPQAGEAAAAQSLVSARCR